MQPCVRVCACASAQAKGCTRTKSWGLGIGGAHVETPDLAVCCSVCSALTLRLCLSLSLSHTHTDVHAPHSTAPRPELVLQSPHTQCTAISPDKAPLCSSLHELIPPALWPQLGLLTRETNRERERERGGGGRGDTHTYTHTHTRAHTGTHAHHHTYTRVHTHSPLPHTYVHAHTSQHREKVRGSREWKERQGQTHSIRDPQRERRGRHWERVRQSGNPDGDRKTGRQRGCRAPGTERVLELQRAGWKRPSWSQCVHCTHNPDTPRTFPAAPRVGVRQVMHPPTEPQGQRAVGRSFAGVEGALERLGTTQGKESREGWPEVTLPRHPLCTRYWLHPLLP